MKHHQMLIAVMVACGCNGRVQTDEGVCFYEDPQRGPGYWCDDQPPEDGPEGATRHVAGGALSHTSDGPCDPCPGPELDDLFIESGRRGVDGLGPSASTPCTYERTRVLKVHRECHNPQPVDGRCGYQGYIWYVCE
jgi:hypothetical protein